MAKNKASKVRVISMLNIIFFILTIMSPLTSMTVVAESGTELTNVALGKPVTSSEELPDSAPSYPGHEAQNIVNGDINLGWSADSGEVAHESNGYTAVKPWAQIDLQGQYIISRIEVEDRRNVSSGHGERRNFQIQVSNDESFSDYVVLEEVGPNVGDEEFPDESTWKLEVTDETPYRYVRYQKTVKEYCYVAELRVFGTLVEVPEEPQDPGEITELYVSPSGDDSNDGAIDSPFATIKGARDYVRTINDDMIGNIIVYFRGGEYKFSESVTFNSSDSGTNGYSIIYTNYPGETPIFTGAQEISGWTDEGGIFKTNVGDLKFRDLYVNGNRGMRARTQSYKIKGWNASGRNFSIDSSAFDGWENVDVTKAEAVLNTHWVESYTRMKSYSINGDRAAVSLASMGDIIFTREHPDRAINQSVHFENSYEFMDKPGEWFLDEDSGDLFYIPREGEGLGGLDARIGTVENFIEIKGTMNDRVENVTIKGITFEYTTFNFPIENDGVIFSQGGFVRGDSAVLGSIRQPAALYMEGADNVTIERNTFRHLGATGIDVKYMAHNNKIIGNALTDIAGNGIMIGVFNDEASGYSHTNSVSHAKDNLIANNYLKGISADYYDSTGIITGYTSGTIVEHNEISDVGYSAIGTGWGWTAANTSLANTVIRNNNIYNYVTRQSDGAAIYTLSKTPNAVIAGNYIHDDDRNEFASSYPLAAIYLDQNSSGFNVRDNVMVRVYAKIHLNMVDENLNSFSNNDSLDEDIIANAGLQPEYWDIAPGMIAQTSDAEWTADTYGAVRISGEVTAKTDGVHAAVYKNEAEVWSVELREGETETYLLNIDVLPDDKISFEGTGALWNTLIKPEVYVPRLVITEFSHPNQVEPAEISDRYKTVTLKVAEGTNFKDFEPVIVTPPGTELVIDSEIPDYSSPVTMRVYMKEDSEFLGFDGGRKYKEWQVKVLVETKAAFIKGFSIGDQIQDADNWYTYNCKKEAGTNSLAFTSGGYSIYSPRMFNDELLEFYMNTRARGGDWPGITFRAQSPTADPIGSNSSSYIVIIKEEVIELQRFNNGERTGLYLTGVGGSEALIGDAIQNTFFNHGQDNLIQIGAMNVAGEDGESDDVRLVMYINGKKVFDCIDKWEGKITEPGYLGTHQVPVPITLSKAPVTTNLGDTIDDVDNWYTSVQGAAEASTNTISFAQGSYSIYKGEQYGDELVEFTMNTNAVGGNWPAITFRGQSTTADPIGANSSSYIVVVKEGVIELQRFNNGARTGLYLTDVGENAPLIGDAIQNTFFNHGEDNLIRIGAINIAGEDGESDDVRLVMYINGQKVFDCIDKWEGKINTPGYFGTHQVSNPVTISKTPESTSISDLIADADGWYASEGSNTITADTNELTFSAGGYSIYQNKQFGAEMLEFYMNTNAQGSDWPAIMFRAQSDTEEPIGTDSSSYIVVIKEEVIELQRFNNGTRTGLYLTGVGEDAPLIDDAIQNTFFKHGEDNLIQLASINVGGEDSESDDVRLVMYINGQKVFDVIDIWEGKIAEPGYFALYHAPVPIKLSKAFEVSTESDILGLLDFEIQKVEDTLATAPVGTEEGEYALWAQEYLMLTLAEVQGFRGTVDDDTPKDDVADALNQLKNALDVFRRSVVASLTNIALGKDVTSSDGDDIYVGHDPSKLVDGFTGSANGWSVNNYEGISAWAQIDLGSISGIERIEVVPRIGNAQDEMISYDGPRKNFEIRASNDPEFTDYVVLGGVGSQPFGVNETWKLDIPEGTEYRYVRYQRTDVDYYFYLSEVRVFGKVLPETFAVSGVVTDSSQQPVEGAAVNIYSFDDQTESLGTATTSAGGAYEIPSQIIGGKYIVKAAKGEEIGSVIVYVPFSDISGADIVLAEAGQSDQFTIGAPIFKDALNNNLSNLVPSTDLRASVDIVNNFDIPGNACFILALYDPKGRVENIAYIEGEIKANKRFTLNAGFTLPSDVEGYQVKVFVWDSITGMQPLSNSVTFK